MWSIFNKLFGWDYIVWENSCDGAVERIRIDGEGRAYFWQYGKYACNLEGPYRGTTRIACWLTCAPEKYTTISKVEP